MILLAKPTAVLLSTAMGVGCCGWPISIRAVLISIADYVTKKAAPISASAADVIVNFSILQSTNIGLLRA